jgi:L-ascorbate metabolism protein UlaG (beta-lactamase superfamily)
MLAQFGAKPSKSDIETYARSKQWNEVVFENAEPTTIDVNFFTLPRMLYKQFSNRANREPGQPLPIHSFNKDEFLKPGPGVKAVWFGHSAILMRIANTTVFIDPMLGPNAAPISPFPVKRFSENTLDLIDQLPDLDLVLLSHDHYDHLDYESILKLRNKTNHFFVALGVGRHLKKWGIGSEKITEFDWWDDRLINDLKITFTPSRHFSGRGLTDRSKSLWGGWVFRTDKENIWFSGDGGYGPHFKEIGKRLAPFDFAFMECGQYSDLWHQIHMYPEESVQAAIDAGAEKAMPVHWGAFSLAQHPWTEPAERWAAEAGEKGVDYIMPGLGETIDIHSGMKAEWWKSEPFSK